MSAWIKSTAWRFVAGLLLITLAAFLLTWWPTHQAKALIIRQKNLSSQAVSQLKASQDYLNNLPVLSAQNIRKQGAIKFYADQAKRVSDQFNKLTIVRPGNLSPIFGLSTTGESKIINDVNYTLAKIHQQTVYTQARNDTDLADKLLQYHAQVSVALVNILEYDPVADTQGFDLKSPDTQQRLKLAHDGLVKTDQQLQAAKKIYQEPSIDQVTALISGLRYARYNLSQNSNTAIWINMVEDAQAEIIKNRIAFWDCEPSKVQIKLASDQKQMVIINNLWKGDAEKYNLN